MVVLTMNISSGVKVFKCSAEEGYAGSVFIIIIIIIIRESVCKKSSSIRVFRNNTL